MQPDDIAIKVDNLGKCFQIYEQPRDRLKQFILPRAQRTFGMQPKQYFREFWALKDVSFEVKKGETVGIIGRNGSGKSTLLQMICGTLTPSQGSVQTSGRIAALLELGSGFNPEFTGRENVYMNATVLGLSKEEIDARYDAIIAFADIGDFIDQPVKTYSSGMYVRLAFAVIAHVDANILVIDEALAVGDIFFTQKCMRFLSEFRKSGTVIFVTHDTSSVVAFCNHAIWLERGSSILRGTAKYVCEAYLAKRYNASNIAPTKPSAKTSSYIAEENALSKRDARMDFINHSNLRNDIQVFDFSCATNGFGNGGAKITHAVLTNMDAQPLSWVVGGEMVRVEVQASVFADCSNIIVGFQLKNKLGQILFAQNTYSTYCLAPVRVRPEESIKATFTFRIPILPTGKYMVDVAIANGTPDNATILQWLHDAFMLESHTSSIQTGLIGLLFDSIELSKGSVCID